ncbi:MAG: GNAT family N-acetyltransferase [Prochloraceae cyanobacterium]
MNNRASRLVIIRRGKPQDREELFQVTMKSIEALCAKDYTSKQLQCLLRDKSKRFRRGIKLGETIYVAQLQGKIIGYSSLLSKSIGAMFVLPEYARQGIGKELLTTIENEAIARKCKVLTAIASLTGVPFYQACGYRPLENYYLSLEDCKIGNNIEIPCIKMEKLLVPYQNNSQEGIFDVWMGMGKMAKWILEGGKLPEKIRK